MLRLHLLIGPRQEGPINPLTLCSLVPDLATCDVFACGPAQLLGAVRDTTTALGIPDSRVHIESFDL